MVRTFVMENGQKPAEKQLNEIIEVKKHPIVFDKDCPELSPAIMKIRCTAQQSCKRELHALKSALGITGTLKFLEQFDNGGSGNYTAEKYECKDPEPSDAEIRKMFGF